MLPQLRSAGYLHDIGKVAVDRRLFGKPSALDPEEFREMADHTTVGHQIVSSVQFPWPKIPETVRWHHERSDGSGYPDKLTQDDLPMQVRIVGLADSFDAMTSARPYRAPLSVGSALSDLVRMAPDEVDPNVVQGLLIQVRRDVVGSNRAPMLDRCDGEYRRHRHRSTRRHSATQSLAQQTLPHQRERSLAPRWPHFRPKPFPSNSFQAIPDWSMTATFSLIRVHN